MAKFPTSAQSFTLSLSEFAKAAPEQARTVVRRVSIDMLTKVVMRTPVGNPSLWKSKPLAGYVGGRLRANWHATFGAPSFQSTAERDPAGTATIMRGTSTINRAYGDHDIYITNSLPYAIPVEYGHSKKQAPAGMVRITVTEFQTFVDNAVRQAASS